MGTTPFLALAVLIAPSGMSPQESARALVRPISGNVHERTMRVDAAGRTTRMPQGIASQTLQTVFDNTCTPAFFLALNTQEENGPGSTGPMATGDWGALPNTSFGGRATCTPGCADSYEIRQFTIAYCTSDAVPIDMVLHFWNRTATGGSGLNACDGTQLIAGMVPPAVPRASWPASPTGMADFTLTGLPRSSTTGTSACYAIGIVIDTPGFVLDGGAAGLTTLGLTGERFSWSMQVTSGTGNTGPVFAGNPSFGTSCAFCTGTVWEPGGPSTDGGLGLGETVMFWLDTYGGSTPSTGNCYWFHASPYGSWELSLAAYRPCGTEGGFCDAADGSLAACPCGNGGLGDTGCDNAQGTGGVGIGVLAQTTSPNGATLVGTGFPTLSSPAAIVLRASALDPAAPVVFGDGLRCIATNPLVRLGATAASGGTSTHAFGHGSMSGSGDFFYQVWYRNTPSTFCDPTAAFNLSDGVQLTW